MDNELKSSLGEIGIELPDELTETLDKHYAIPYVTFSDGSRLFKSYSPERQKLAGETQEEYKFRRKIMTKGLKIRKRQGIKQDERTN